MKSLLLLLESLSEEKIQNEDNKNIYSYDFIKKCFKQTKVPLIIDETSIEEQNQFLFYIQLEILFDFYSTKVNQIMQSSQSKQKIKSKLTFKNSPLRSSNFNDSETESSDDSSNQESNSTETDTDTDTETDEFENENDEENQSKNLFPNNYKEEESESENVEEEEEEKMQTSKESHLLANIKIDKIEVIDYDEAGSSSEYSTEDDEDEKQSNNKKQPLLKDDKQNQKEIKKKKKLNNFILFEEKKENILLNTLNALSTKMNMQKVFNNIHETIEDEWIPKFVMNTLKIKKIDNVYLSNKKIFHGLKELTQIEQKNIKAVIEFLKEKESKFEILIFNFANQDLCESSAILFYNTFLNFFFLKQSRQKMLNYCITILTLIDKKIKNIKYDELDLLTKWETYDNLINFATAKHRKNKNMDQNECNSIPIILDKDFLQYCLKQQKIPDEIYYQLQFIFDAINTQFAYSTITERFLNAISKLNEVKVPRIGMIAASIRAKNISLILQMRRHKQFILENGEKNIKEEEESTEKTGKNKGEKNTENFDNKVEVEGVNEDEEEDKNDIPLNYLDRLVIYSDRYLKNEKKKKISLIKFENAVKFWNPPNNDYIFEDGILINKTLNNEQNIQNKSELRNEIKNILKNSPSKELKKSKPLNQSKIQLFNDPSFKSKTQLKFYKIFNYDEQKNKWILNHNDFDQFEQHINCKTTNLKTPLILFFNSNENDLISINSKLINNLYPSFDKNDEEIFVYALCDRNLCYLNYEIDTKKQNKSNIKPIFLNLHVPKIKEKNPSILSIVVSIYSFLSLICDIEIILLDDQYYRSQIEILEIINNKMIKSFELSKKSNKTSNKKSEKKIKQQHQKSSNKDKTIVYEIHDSDDDDYDYDDSFYEENDSDSDDHFIINNDFKKKTKMIFLINDEQANQKVDLNQNYFFQNLLKNINEENKSINLINTNEPSTYKPFLDALNSYSEDCETKFDQLKEQMQFVNIANASNLYISLKTKEIWKEELEKIIQLRYFMLLKSDTLVVNQTSVVSKLENEISRNSLPFDVEFVEQCKLIIEKLKLNIIKKNQEYIKSELETSSKKYIENLKKFNEYDYLSTEKVDNIIIRHIRFIKDEFFDIIKTISDPKFCNIIYEKNKNILNQQIEKDISQINKIAEEERSKYIENIENKEIDEELKGGTNYLIRENVNVREIKVQIEFGQDLKGIIDQDF